MSKSHQQGVAIVIVLLISAITLMTFLFASATLTVASRTAAASERNSTQALLAADSGLNTLRARSTTIDFDTSYGTFANWIETHFASLDLGAGINAQLSVIAENEDRLTVQSVGTAGSSTRTIVQDFEVLLGPPIPASANVPGALTSVGSIRSNSASALVQGRDNTEQDWSYANVELCAATEGEYVVLSGITYRVEGPSDCDGDMDLVRVDTGEVESHSGTTPVTHRPIAITEPLAVSGSSPPTSVVNVTDPAQSLFGVGSPITIGDGSEGEVVGVDGTELTIEWSVAPHYQPEGTVVRRAVSSGVTAEDCDIQKNHYETTFPHGCEAEQDLSNLFYKTFGIASPSLLKDSLPDSNKISNQQVRDGRVLSGITWVDDPENNFRGQQGSGILIIENNPGQEITLNVQNKFTGLIYVIGNADIQGNADYQGAIIVDGVATVNTQVQGTTDIEYDPLSLVRALADITFPNPNPGGLGLAIDDTWRIR